MIVVLGSINLDTLFEVERLPSSGETVHAHNRFHFGGGKGANQVLAAKRGGADVVFFGAVGDDRAAEIALCGLTEAGVAVSDIAIVDKETGSANIYVDRRGENSIVVAAGANGLVDIGMAAAAVAVAKGGLLILQQEIPSATIKAALELARPHNVRTVLNISPFDTTSAELSRLADIVIANQHEWTMLNDEIDTAAAMIDWSNRHGQILVVTKGAGGVAVSSPSNYFEVAAPAIRPVDTVGAGDTFCGYFAAELDRGGSLREASEIATVAASMACLKEGAQPSVPLRNDVVKTMSRDHQG